MRRLLDYPWMPAHRAGRRGAFKEDPIGLLIHSGSRAPGVAEWFGNRLALAWTMFAWSAEHEGFAQCDHLGQTTSHGGRWWNDFTIGIELPGPYTQCPRPTDQAEKLVVLVSRLVATYPSITFATTHASITKRKKDPGPGFTASWLAGLGLQVRIL